MRRCRSGRSVRAAPSSFERSRAARNRRSALSIFARFTPGGPPTSARRCLPLVPAAASTDANPIDDDRAGRGQDREIFAGIVLIGHQGCRLTGRSKGSPGKRTDSRTDTEAEAGVVFAASSLAVGLTAMARLSSSWPRTGARPLRDCRTRSLPAGSIYRWQPSAEDHLVAMTLSHLPAT